MEIANVAERISQQLKPEPITFPHTIAAANKVFCHEIETGKIDKASLDEHIRRNVLTVRIGNTDFLLVKQENEGKQSKEIDPLTSALSTSNNTRMCVVEYLADDVLKNWKFGKKWFEPILRTGKTKLFDQYATGCIKTGVDASVLDVANNGPYEAYYIMAQTSPLLLVTALSLIDKNHFGEGILLGIAAMCLNVLLSTANTTKHTLDNPYFVRNLARKFTIDMEDVRRAHAAHQIIRLAEKLNLEPKKDLEGEINKWCVVLYPERHRSEIYAYLFDPMFRNIKRLAAKLPPLDQTIRVFGRIETNGNLIQTATI